MKDKGFTLIELLVVIVIVGILTAIAALGYSRWTIKFRVEQQIKEMYADLMDARTKAMTRNSNHVAALTAAQYTIWDDTDSDGTIDAGEIIITQRTLKYQIGWDGINQISFNSRGLFSNNEQEKTISVLNATNASYDCIVISATRINMGKMSGGSCGQK